MTSQTQRQLTTEEFRTLLENATNISPRHGFTVYLLGHSGLTTSEAAAFTQEWFDPQERRITVPRKDGEFSTMTEARAREIPLRTPAAEKLREYLHTLPEKALNVVPSAITHRVKMAAQSSEIGNVTPHLLRRTYGFQLQVVGVPIEQIEQILGVRSSQVTEPPRHVVDLDEYEPLYNTDR